jgi:hypothetical protein
LLRFAKEVEAQDPSTQSWQDVPITDRVAKAGVTEVRLGHTFSDKMEDDAMSKAAKADDAKVPVYLWDNQCLDLFDNPSQK